MSCSTYENKKLGDLFFFKNGRAFKKTDWGNSGLPIIRIQNLNSFDANFNFYSGEYSDAVLVKKGDLLFSWSGTVGSSFGPHIWNREQGLLNQHIFRVTFKTEIDKQYAYYALHKITEDIERQVSGAVGLVHITKEKLNQFCIPVPSKSEQKRIVSILDESFEAIDIAKANTEKNLQNARALFDSYLNEFFTNNGNGYDRYLLETFCELISGQHIDAKNYNTTQQGIGYLTGPSDFGKTNPVITKWTEFPKRTAAKGDILITVKGSGVGKINMLHIDNIAISRQLMAIRPKTALVGYLFAFLSTKYNYLQSLSNGAAIPGISREDVLHLECPLPSIDEQKLIVNKVEELEKNVIQLESIYQNKLVALEELKKSLLHQAFCGGL